MADVQTRLSELERSHQQVLRSVGWWKRISLFLGLVLLSIVCIAAQEDDAVQSSETLTVRKLYVAAADGSYGMLLSADQEGASILMSKDGEQGPAQSAYLGVGGKGQAAVGVQAEGFSITIGDGSPSILVQDFSVPGQPKTARLAVE